MQGRWESLVEAIGTIVEDDPDEDVLSDPRVVKIVGDLEDAGYWVDEDAYPIPHVSLTDASSAAGLVKSLDHLSSAGGLRALPEATGPRIDRLQAYFDANVLGAQGFCCESGAECRASLRGKPFDLFEGQLSHVGHHYDLTRDGVPIRIMVVGQEVGRPPRLISMVERHRWILEHAGFLHRMKADGDFPARNPHMKGTMLALQVLLGLESDKSEPWLSEWVQDPNGRLFHAFDAFALVNALLCSAVKRGKTTGRATSTMQKNCSRHFAETTAILEPTVVVLQGKGVRKWVEPAFDDWRELSPTLATASIRGREMVVASLTHPSAYAPYRWDSAETEYFQQTARPTLERARALALDLSRGEPDGGAAGGQMGAENLEPGWAAWLPTVPEPVSSAAGEFVFKDGTSHEAVMQFYEDISSEVLTTRLVNAMEELGWVSDPLDLVHPSGVVVHLRVEEPKPNHLMVTLIRLL